jgi:hypothetical protein
MSKQLSEKLILSIVIYYALLWFFQQPLPFIDFFPDMEGFKTILLASLVILGSLTLVKLPKTD